MARTTCRPTPTAYTTLTPLHDHCAECGAPFWIAYHNFRTVTTLAGVTRLTLKIRRCRTRACSRFRRPYRPEAEGAIALPKGEFGLDVIAFVGLRRYRRHESIPEIHAALRRRGVVIAERTVTHLL